MDTAEPDPKPDLKFNNILQVFKNYIYAIYIYKRKLGYHISPAVYSLICHSPRFHALLSSTA
jgi:hypothetical protein